MSDIVIKVQNLYKEYRLGVVNHGTLRHDLSSEHMLKLVLL